MNFNKKEKSLFSLKAISINHKINEFKDVNSAYQIFNPNYHEYFLTLDKTIDTNELSRCLIKFFQSQTKNVFNVDLNSFLEQTAEKYHNDIIAIVVDSIEYASTTPYSAKTNNKTNLQHNLIFDKKYTNIVEEYFVVAQDKTFARKLQDMPSNIANPAGFEELMTKHLKGLKNVKISVLSKKELKAKNMNLLLAVGNGCTKANDESRLMIVEYLPNKKDKNVYGFVGKGVCFDTGGLNIKPGNHMRWMKYDMSGAAIVGALVHSLATNKINKNVIVAMPLVLNLAGNLSYRPDDILIAHNGKSVEIDNTDAEGRLILADSLSYLAQDKKVSMLYDVATLTGAMIYALGDTYTGVWTTTDKLWEEINYAGNQAGELVWRLPFHHDFKDLLKSKFADIVNSVSDPRGGSSRAAMFLKEFTNNLPYAHFDIAGTGDKGNTGTGVMLHTFYNLIKNK